MSWSPAGRDGAPVVGAWLPWFYQATRWRAVRVKSPTTGRTQWFGPRNLTDENAQIWLSEMVESNWDKECTLFTHSPSGWRE
jgi:hypothetical protein